MPVDGVRDDGERDTVTETEKPRVGRAGSSSFSSAAELEEN